MAGEHVVHVGSDNWESEVLKSDIPVLVDMWAEWCGPCRAIAPALEQIAGEMAGKLKVAKVNIDDHPELASQYGVRSIPTLLLIIGGEVRTQMVGAMSKSALLDKIAPLIES